MMYRLTYRNMGNWHDIKESGETFDYETEAEAISTLEAIHWRNWRGESLNYREVSDKELEAERGRLASIAAFNF